MRILLLSLYLMMHLPGFTQEFVLPDEPGDHPILLNKGWVYCMRNHSGDLFPPPEDSCWKPISPDADIYKFLPEDAKKGIGFMQLRFRVSETAQKQKLALSIQQSIASEVFLNGNLIERFGTISENPSAIRAYDPLWKPVPVYLSADSIQTLMIRFAVQPGLRFTTLYGSTNPIFAIELMEYDQAVKIFRDVNNTWIYFLIIGILTMLLIVHFSFYIIYPEQDANLYLCLYAFSLILSSIFKILFYYNGLGNLFLNDSSGKFIFGNLSFFLVFVAYFFSILTIYRFLKIKPGGFSLFVLVFIILCLFLNTGIYDLGWKIGGTVSQLLIYLTIIRISYMSMQQNKPGAKLFFYATIGTMLSFLAFISIPILSNDKSHHLRSEYANLMSLFNILNILGLPAAISVFLANDFALTSKKLKHKLKEVQELSAINIRAEKEKQELLASQNIQLEQKVNERTQALTQSLQELKEAQAQLIHSEKMASLGELTAGIAHEIQNPLNFVNNFSEVNKELAEELESEADQGNLSEVKVLARDIRKNEERINLHGKRADAIVKSMLQHSRSSNGQKEPTDINALCDEYLRLAYHGMRARDMNFNVGLETNYDKTIGKTQVIPQDIGRVLLNIFNNALYAVIEKKKSAQDGYEPLVSVMTRRNGDNTVIIVKDNGPGIPGHSIEKIFQPFFTTKPTGQGTGLGLSLSYDIIKAHGGEIRVENLPGSGVVFFITIP